MLRRYCLTLDLKNDPELIAEYKKYHEQVWPEITRSIRESGIADMEIYLLGTRMFMIMEANEKFSLQDKQQADLANSKVQEWEKLMWKFQQALPGAKPGEKWLPMERIFKLENWSQNPGILKGEKNHDRTSDFSAKSDPNRG